MNGILVGVAALTLGGAYGASADVLVMEDGRRIRGELVSVNRGTVIFDEARPGSSRPRRLRVTKDEVTSIVLRETTVEDDAQGMRKIEVALSDSQGRIFKLEAGPAPFEDSASRVVVSSQTVPPVRFLRPDGGAPPLFDNAVQTDVAPFSTSDFRLKVTFSTPNHQLRLPTGLLPLDKTLPPGFVFVDGVQVFLQKAD